MMIPNASALKKQIEDAKNSEAQGSVYFDHLYEQEAHAALVAAVATMKRLRVLHVSLQAIDHRVAAKLSTLCAGNGYTWTPRFEEFGFVMGDISIK